MKRIIAGIFVLAFSSTFAHAGAWDDVLTTITTSPGFTTSPQNPTGLPATSIFISGYASNCPVGFIPAATGGPDASRLNPIGFGSGQCSMLQTAIVNINQFARASDLAATSASLAALGAQFAASNAQLNAALNADRREARIGVAEALAMAGTADLQSDEHFSVAVNVGTFGGQSAFAGGGAARIGEHTSINAGLTVGTSGGPVGARAGIRFGW